MNQTKDIFLAYVVRYMCIIINASLITRIRTSYEYATYAYINGDTISWALIQDERRANGLILH